MTLSTEKTQQFPNGPSLRVFVVGDDIAILNSIWNLCFLQYHYEVSIFSTISLALNILKDGNDCVDIILIDAQMKDASSYSFVKYVKQQNKIPIMMISVDGSHNAMTKALENGAHAVWGKTFDENCIFEMQSLVIKMHLENKQDQKKRKRGRDIIKNAPVTNGCVVENHHNHNHTQKKNFKWKTDLHEQFVKVVNQLGPAKVKPKEIMKLMNVPGLTQAIVSSHLQKFNKKSKRTPLSNETPEERNDNPDTITGEFLDLSASAPTQLGLKVAHPIPEQNLNVILDSVNKCDKNPKGNHQSALGASAEQDNKDNQDTNTSRVIDFLPQGPQPSREVVHPIPEQNHNATWDSADQCDNNSLETEQNCHKSDLNLWLDQPGSTFAELVEILKNQDTELQLGLKVAHPIPEQNHNATWDSAAHCANNSFETELNIPKILLAMNQYLNEDANCKTFEEEPQLSLGALADQDDSTHKSTRTEELLPPNQGN